MMTWVAIFLGGGLGSMARYGVSRLVLGMEMKSLFPWATLFSNLISTALLAWFILKGQQMFHGREALRAFLFVGICGGFSTFSTFSQENYHLLRSGMIGHAVANILVSVVAGILLFHFIARSS